MVKYLKIFPIVIIFFTVSCLDSLEWEWEVRRYEKRLYNELYIALLKRWQESDDWQRRRPEKFVGVNWIHDIIITLLGPDVYARKFYLHKSRICGIISRAMIKYYNIGINDSWFNGETAINYTVIGERKEYWLVSTLRTEVDSIIYTGCNDKYWRESEVYIWFLVSRIDGKVLSTISFPEIDFINYHTLTNVLKLRHIELRQQWPNYNRSIDSATAGAIGVAAATKHHGLEMALLDVRLTGFYDEYWIVYCFPIIPHPPPFLGFSVVDTSAQKGFGSCYRAAVDRFVYGKSMREIDNDICHRAVVILISRENGQILSMKNARMSWLDI